METGSRDDRGTGQPADVPAHVTTPYAAVLEVDSYRDLKVWRLGMELVKETYLLTREFPKHETYGLSSQMQRAAVSIPANIAEGHANDSTKDYLRHLSIARGSLAEIETHLMLAESLDYVAHDRTAPLLAKCAEEGKMPGSLQRRLKAKVAN